MASKVNVALVGCGFGGVRLLRDLLHLNAEVVIVDPVAAHRHEGIKLGAAEAVSTLSELPRVHGIVIGAPVPHCEEAVEDALGHKVPVLTERPFSTDVDAATRLADLAQGRLFVMHTMRYHVGVGELGSIATNGELGLVEWLRVTRTGWSNQHQDPDLAWSLLSQDLSIVLEILGEIPPPLLAVPELHAGRPCGVVAVLGDVPRVVIEDSIRYSDNRREVRLHCAEGVAVLPDMTSGYIEITLNQNPDEHNVPSPERRQYAPEQPLLRQLRSFLEYLPNRRRKKPRSSVEDGLNVVRATGQLRTLAGF